MKKLYKSWTFITINITIINPKYIKDFMG
jgi:hypothetical protein